MSKTDADEEKYLSDLTFEEKNQQRHQSLKINRSKVLREKKSLSRILFF